MANVFDLSMDYQLDGFFAAFGASAVIKHVAANATETLLSDAVFDLSTMSEMEYLDSAGRQINAEAILTFPTPAAAFDIGVDHITVDGVEWRAVAIDISTPSLSSYLMTKTRHVLIRTIRTRRKR
tara:strand:- start:6222 stop:6596 length:375 start_codon:yes stop_codon:yes gene_type:complete